MECPYNNKKSFDRTLHLLFVFACWLPLPCSLAEEELGMPTRPVSWLEVKNAGFGMARYCPRP